MTLGLFPQETQDGYDALQRMSPAGPVSPGFFARNACRPLHRNCRQAVGVGESIMSGATDLAAVGLRDIQGATGGALSRRSLIPEPHSHPV